jgi:hypothetical protein
MNILYALCEWRLDECAVLREVVKQAVCLCSSLFFVLHEKRVQL